MQCLQIPFLKSTILSYSLIGFTSILYCLQTKVDLFKANSVPKIIKSLVLEQNR